MAELDGRCSLRTWVYRVAHNTAISRVVRPRATAPTLVAMDADLESVAEAVDREQSFDRRRALDRLYALIQGLRPLDRQVRYDVALDEIRAKAQEFDARVQRWNLVGGLTLALLIAKNVWEVIADVDLVERAGDLFLLIALLYVVHRLSTHARAHARPAALGETSCMDHYRAQLVRQRELSRDGWKYIVPFVPGLALIVVGRGLEGRPASQVAVLIVFALALLAGVLWAIARSTRELEREIAALDGE